MGRKTKIDWADSSWNPVTGCRHGCEYCYAQRIARRYGGKGSFYPKSLTVEKNGICVLDRPALKSDGMTIAPYPFGFDPTFHRYKLDVPKGWKKPRNVFVCSMADLFGAWVPDEWIKAVFDACKAGSQHRYLFLTKNPQRYIELSDKGLLPSDDNFWFGYSATKDADLWRFHHADECPVKHLFVSVEPILGPLEEGFSTHLPADWVIVGAETGNRASKVVPEKSWIDFIKMDCEYSGRPLFMKESLREIMGADFRQEFPWR